MDDLISRQAAIDALNGIINRFEQILRDIRESKVDDSVCGLCEYDGAYMGQSGDWCNECPGFEKDDCFRLSDECRKRWLESVELPAAQPEERTETHACDLISRQAAIDADELIKQACRSTEWSHGEHPMVVEVDDIGDAPTVDAEPVKHAHVVWTESNTSHKTQCCSNCHRTFISRHGETIEFCPHCGAKMDDHEGELK